MLACMTGPPDTTTIPSDLATCQTLIKEQAYLVEAQTHTIGDLHGQIKTLKQEQEEFKLQIKLLIERAFGRRSERYLSDPNQLLIDFGDDAADAADGLAEAIDEADLEEQLIPEQVIPAHVRRKKKKASPRRPAKTSAARAKSKRRLLTNRSTAPSMASER